MKILMMSQGVPTKKYPMNGIHQFAYAEALKKAGVDVIVGVHDIRSVFRLRKPGFFKMKKDGLDVYGYHQFIETKDPVKAGEKSVKGFDRLYRRIKEEDSFDLIHAHFYEYAYGAARSSLRTEPLVVSEHASSVNRDRLKSKDPRRYRAAKTVYDAADAVIVGSPFFEKRMEDNFGISPLVLPTITDDDVFVPGTSEDDVFHIVSTGNLKPQKGQRELLVAFGKYFRDRKADLTIIGSGPDEKYLKEYTKEKNLEDRVRFTGQLSQEEIAEIYKKSDLFVLASRTETYGKVYVEAMAAGLPCVTVNNGGSEHFITDFNGKVAEVSNPDSLGMNMLEIYENIDRYDSDKIRRYEQKHFSRRKATEDLTAVYREILMR